MDAALALFAADGVAQISTAAIAAEAGTALLQLGQLAGLRMYGIASAGKHDVLKEYGAIPIDYHTQDFAAVLREAEPGGLDAVFDGMGGDYIERGFALLKRGGTWVAYGNPMSFSGLLLAAGFGEIHPAEFVAEREVVQPELMSGKRSPPPRRPAPDLC